uniref:(northern house mosquito) hypothetical protein n=1 Tax=Culex pipiens TaxID=7175 RepID=A0A8D8H4M1_CULPI
MHSKFHLMPISSLPSLPKPQNQTLNLPKKQTKTNRVIPHTQNTSLHTFTVYLCVRVPHSVSVCVCVSSLRTAYHAYLDHHQREPEHAGIAGSGRAERRDERNPGGPCHRPGHQIRGRRGRPERRRIVGQELCPGRADAGLRGQRRGPQQEVPFLWWFLGRSRRFRKLPF